jgi:hypothetical protein
MAKRPVFMICDTNPYFKEEMIEFKFFSGFSELQRQKSIKSLHEAFLNKNLSKRVLEVSSKSEIGLGIKLSAFNLMIETRSGKSYSVESAFQSSKVFENGGPFNDLLDKTSKEAKKDPRLISSGKLKYFEYGNRKFELTPTTYFYNWLYVNALNLHPDITEQLVSYDAFTDIVFNPEKSINCQARAVAIYVSLNKNKLLKAALKDEKSFLNVVYGKDLNKNISSSYEQISLLD